MIEELKLIIGGIYKDKNGNIFFTYDYLRVDPFPNVDKNVFVAVRKGNRFMNYKFKQNGESLETPELNLIKMILIV